MTYKSAKTLASLVTDLDEARALALRTDQPGAAVSAIQLQAKLLGLLVERKETGAPGDFAALGSAEEIIAKIRAEMGDKAADALASLIAAQPAARDPDELAAIPEPESGAIN